MIIDWEKFKATFQYYDKGVIIQIVEIFESEFDERFAKMRSNLESMDFEQLKFNAHSFKGVVSNFMAPEPYALARQMEDQAKNGIAAGIQELFEQLFDVSLQMREELRQYKNSL